MGDVLWPGQIDTWTDKIDNVDIYHADDINAAHKRIIKIQQVLGLIPQSTYATVSARIADLAQPVAPFPQVGVLEGENLLDSLLTTDTSFSIL
jgi:hypothetical protein